MGQAGEVKAPGAARYAPHGLTLGGMNAELVAARPLVKVCAATEGKQGARGVGERGDGANRECASSARRSQGRAIAQDEPLLPCFGDMGLRHRMRLGRRLAVILAAPPGGGTPYPRRQHCVQALLGSAVANCLLRAPRASPWLADPAPIQVFDHGTLEQRLGRRQSPGRAQQPLLQALASTVGSVRMWVLRLQHQQKGGRGGGAVVLGSAAEASLCET